MNIIRNILLIAILCMPCISVYANNAVVIKSQNIKSYEKAFQGFKSVYEGKIKEYTLFKDLETYADGVVDSIKHAKADIVIAIGSQALLFATDNLKEVPVVYCMVMHPENYGIQYNSNIFCVPIRVSVKEQIKNMKSYLPGLKKVGVIYNPFNTAHVIMEAKETCDELGLELVAKDVLSRKAVPNALEELKGDIDAMLLIADNTVVTQPNVEFIISYTLKNNIPLMTYSDAFTKVGALMSLSVNYFSVGRQTAKLAHDVLKKNVLLKGNTMKPEHSHLIVNIDTARAIGVD